MENAPYSLVEENMVEDKETRTLQYISGKGRAAELIVFEKCFHYIPIVSIDGRTDEYMKPTITSFKIPNDIKDDQSWVIWGFA